MNKIHILYCCLVYLVSSNLCISSCLAAGGGTGVVSDKTNNTLTSDTNITSDSNINTTNQNILLQSGSSSNSYDPSGSQCGLSISGKYINSGNQDAFQVISTFNTNPCINPSNIEKVKQENESQRELIRANTQIIITCINARIQAAKQDINPDVICKFAPVSNQLFSLPKI